MINKKVKLFIYFLFLLTGCSSRQEQNMKEFVIEIITSKKQNINTVFIENKAITYNFLDSAIRNKPSEFFDTVFYAFSRGYILVGTNKSLIPSIYHKYYMNKNRYMDILVATSKLDRFIRFTFKYLKNSKLELYNIKFSGNP